MTPLHVVAHLQGQIAAQSTGIMLDALLQHAEATRRGLSPLDRLVRGPSDLPIPLARSECGRVNLCSAGLTNHEEHELRWKNRRAPIAEMQMLAGPKLKRINITGGANRSYRIPLDTTHVEGDAIGWFATGAVGAVRELLGWVGYLGHRRAVGLGRVVRWDVIECEPWDGFPVLRDGLPLRPLPVDWPGLRDDAERALRCLRPPYWRRADEELTAVPS